MSIAPAPSHARSDRMTALMLLLHEHGPLPLSALSKRLHASEATIRRDVSALASQQLLERTHGGARPIRGGKQLPEHLRDSLHQRAKKRIATATAAMIGPGSQVLGMTGGSTTRRVLEALLHRSDLTIITNSLSLGREAMERGQMKTVVVGGVLRPNSLEVVGPLAEATLGIIRLGTAIMGADGFSACGGLTTYDEMGATFHEGMTSRAGRVVVVADSSKIGHHAGAKICDLDRVDHLVTDAAAPMREIARIRDAGVCVTIVTP